MNPISVLSPTRVDLAGGTLDLWPLYLFINGAPTVNVAIDIWTRAEITPLDSSQIELESSDLQIKKTYANLGEGLSDQDPQMRLLQVQMKYWQPTKGFRLKTSSESPIGGGLGGSSSLTVSLLKAFSIFCQRPFASTHQLVNVAHNIEAEVLGTPTGTQDYYPAASGGLNILNYDYNGVSQSVVSVARSVLDDNFMLIYTGRAHHSGLNNFEVMKAAMSKDPGTLRALGDLKVISQAMVEACQQKQWTQIPELFRQEYEARTRLAPAFSSPEIVQLHHLALQAGAEAVKICGAGGGGCVLVWVTPAHRERVSHACRKAGFQVLSAKPVDLPS